MEWHNFTMRVTGKELWEAFDGASKEHQRAILFSIFDLHAKNISNLTNEGGMLRITHAGFNEGLSDLNSPHIDKYDDEDVYAMLTHILVTGSLFYQFASSVEQSTCLIRELLQELNMDPQGVCNHLKKMEDTMKQQKNTIKTRLQEVKDSGRIDFDVDGYTDGANKSVNNSSYVNEKEVN